MDETYIRVKGEGCYRYRTVDKYGQTVDFLLSPRWDQAAALQFLTKAIRRHDLLETITIDGSEANASALRGYKKAPGTTIVIRQVRYRNTLREQDHRTVKQITRPMLGFKSVEAAQSTRAGVELMHRLKKGQLVVEEGPTGLTPAEQFSAFAA